MTEPVRLEFVVAGETVVGALHLPSGAGPHPAVVVAGPMTSVKEQVTGVYAQALAARGIAALAIDHRHFGQSGGAPRQYENAAHKIEDLIAAFGALAAHEAVDAGRIGGAGVCLGCGYMAWAARQAPQVKALGLVVGYYRDPAAMRAANGADFDAKVAQGAAARARYEATGEVDTIPAAAREGDAAMQTADTVEYYTRRAAIPNYTNAFAVMSREHFLPFDVQAAAPMLTLPVAMVHSEKALSPHWARQFHDALAGERSIDWIASDGQTDFYDNPMLVNAATEIIAAKLKGWL